MQFKTADNKTKDRFIRQLEADFSRETLEYCLFPHPDAAGYGINTNALLLASAGSLYISTDDDIICRPVLPENAHHETVWSDSYLNSDLLYFADRQALLGSVQESEVDVFGRHLRLLGRQSSDILKQEQPEDKNAWISLTNPGIYGDSGMGQSRTALNLTGKSREHLIACGYDRLKCSRELVRLPQRDTVSPSPQLMLMQTGFDNRFPLPPFLPVGRNNEDFCSHLRLIYPESVTGYLSFGLYHNPPDRRQSTYENLVSFRLGIVDLLITIGINSQPDRSISDHAERYRATGRSYQEAASMRTGDFVDQVRALVTHGITPYTVMLEEILEKYKEQPESWADDVSVHIDNVFEVMREPAYLFGSRGCGFTVEQVKNQMKNYGRLIEIWPGLFEAAKNLNMENRGIADYF